MAGRSDIEAGAAYVRLYTKDMDKVLKDFSSFSNKLIGVGAALTGIGVAIGAPLLAAVSHFISVGGAIDDMSHRTGIGREKLGQLAFAGSLVGVKMESIEAAVKGMIKKGFNPSDFDRIVKNINGVSDAFDRARLATHYFGKAGYDIIQLIEEWDSLQKRARELGIGLSGDDVRLADQLGDSLTEVQGLLDSIVAKFGAALAPVLIPILETVTDILTGVAAWAEKNREIVPIIAAVAVGFIAVGAAIIAILGPLSAIATIGEALLAFAVAGAAPWALLAVAIAAVAAVLVAAAAAWLLFTKEGNNTLRLMLAGFEALAKKFDSTISALKGTYKGLVDAVKGGDMNLAWDIVMTGMALSFLEFQKTVEQGFKEMVEKMRNEILNNVDTMAISIERIKQLASQALDLIPGGNRKGKEYNLKAAEPETTDPVIAALRKRLADLNAQAAGLAGQKSSQQGGESISEIAGFNASALLRAGQLVGSTYDPALAKADAQIGLLGKISSTLDAIKNKTGPAVATA